MPDWITQYGAQLGVFAPTAALGFWLIRRLMSDNRELRARNDALTERVFTQSNSTTGVLTELATLVKGLSK